MDEVVTDLTACLEDSALPLMQFTEAFAVVQVRQSHMVFPAAHAQLVHLICSRDRPSVQGIT